MDGADGSSKKLSIPRSVLLSVELTFLPPQVSAPYTLHVGLSCFFPCLHDSRSPACRLSWRIFICLTRRSFSMQAETHGALLKVDYVDLLIQSVAFTALAWGWSRLEIS